MGHVIKRKNILTVLKKEHISIALQQETRLSDKEHMKLKRDWVGQIYFSSYMTNSTGTAILIHKNIPFILEHVEYDSKGRFVLISGLILGRNITVGNVYAPNIDCPNFMS